jgi:HTH-type transcriptional regulator/antitoxin HipB
MSDHVITSLQILGQALKSARQKKGLTQAELGALVGLKQKTISSAENGSPGIRLETLFRLLSGLDLNVILRTRIKALKNHGEW